jgi:hypothetical protein
VQRPEAHFNPESFTGLPQVMPIHKQLPTHQHIKKAAAPGQVSPPDVIASL